MTIKDLAAKTGYAVGTVSRALNNHPNVSEKARTAILQAAQEVGFEIKSLSEILGHANVNITLNRYVHSSFELKSNNMNKLMLSYEPSKS